MEEFKVIVAGGREYADYATLSVYLDAVLDQKRLTHRVTIISGGARGADSLGERYARERGYDLEIFPADWTTHGKKAGPLRNEEMAKVADACVCCWDGSSRGTKSMIALAESYGLSLRVLRY